MLLFCNTHYVFEIERYIDLFKHEKPLLPKRLKNTIVGIS